jgi:CheY-like chemotaxis protein
LKLIKIDKGQIGQVIQNLIINAKQAMARGGVIMLSADNVSIMEKHHLPIPNGEYVRISIQDNGIGIPPEHLNKIFDPFFTTKPGGSGLGLATVFSIIKKHEGHIKVESTPGAGTTFSIYLPATAEKPSPENSENETRENGCGRILVVDDEKFIRDMLKRMLTMSGYDASCVNDGSTAIKIFKQELDSGRPFDLVLIDLTIPGGMGGKEIMDSLLKIDPGVKAIVSSGYSNDPIMAEYEKYGFAGRLAKPYKINDIRRVFGAVLTPARSSSAKETAGID